MDASTFEHTVKDLCIAVGIDDWQVAAQGRHIVVHGHTVGLQHDEDDLSSDLLSIYIELTPVLPSGNEALYSRLLMANLHRSDGARGYFAVHADTGCAVYCLEVRADAALDGRTLAELLETQVGVSASLLRSLEQTSPTTGGH